MCGELGTKGFCQYLVVCIEESYGAVVFNSGLVFLFVYQAHPIHWKG